MQGNPRDELARLWEAHRKAPFPAAYSELEETFGWPEDRPEVHGPDYDELLQMWGAADLHLYDTYVAGHVSSVLSNSRAGSELVGGLKPDERLARYLAACDAEAGDPSMLRKIKEVQSYLQRVNHMLEVARAVPAR